MRKYAALIVALLCVPLFGGTLDPYATYDARLNTSPVLQTYSAVAGYTAQAHLWETKFKPAYGDRWEILIDLRGGKPAHVYGQGVPILPGLGNLLTYTKGPTVGDVAATVFSFVKDNASLFGVNTNELQLDRSAEVDEYWYLSYKRVYLGLEVKGAKLSVTISHGNLVAFGFLNYGDISTSIRPSISSAQAQDALFQAVGGRLAGDELLDPGSLALYPIITNGSTSSTYTGGLGGGYGHLLVWQITFSRGDEGAWTALLDAHTGALISLTRNAASADGKVTGGVYKFAQPGMTKSFDAYAGLPYADIRAYMNCYNSSPYIEKFCSDIGFDPENPPIRYLTNSSGIFLLPDADTGSLETRLISPYIAISSRYGTYHESDTRCTCGDNLIRMCIEQESHGIIALHGTAGRNSCEYIGSPSDPPYNRPGNSNAARTAFYHGTMVKRQWENYLHLPETYDPSLPSPCAWPDVLRCWLPQSLRVEISTGYRDEYIYEQNAPYDYVHLSKEDLFSEGNANSAEIPSIIYHEIGHGIDDHDATGSLYGGKDHAEAYADIVTMLMTHDSCIGRGWYKGREEGKGCYGDGNIDPCTVYPSSDPNHDTCFGYRDLDFNEHASKTRHTVGNWLPQLPIIADDDPVRDPGPCLREIHSEAEIAGQAFWDFVQNLQNVEYGGHDEATAWFIADRLFKRAVNTAGPAFFTCDGDGTDGEPYNSLFTGLVMADDNSGDYSKMGPHYEAIKQAFMSHGIYAQRFPTVEMPCLATFRPTLTATPANGLVHLTWTGWDSGARSEVWRNESGPDMGYTKIAVVYSPEYFDEGLLNGQTYYYRIVPTGGSSTCVGPASDYAQVQLPQTGSLLILPETQSEWVRNVYKTRKLTTYGGSGSCTWSKISGSYPPGVDLNLTTGELYGTPTTTGTYTFSVQAVDTAPGISLSGVRSYTINVVQGGGFDFTPVMLPSVQASRRGSWHIYGVDLLPDSDKAKLKEAFIVPGEGALPEGISCGCQKISDFNYRCSIEGVVNCEGQVAPCSKRGLYKFTVGVRGTVTTMPGQSVERYTERTFELPVFDGTGDAIVDPPEGTTAGGTRIKAYLQQDAVFADAVYQFRPKPDCQNALSGVSPQAMESQDLVYANTASRDVRYEFTTPRGLEGCVDLGIVRPTSWLPVLPKAYQYKTLAYAASAMDGTVHVVDTVDKTLFSPSAMAQTPPDASPAGMALSDGSRPGRELYAADTATGDLLIFNASNSLYEGTVALQNKDMPYYGLGAADVAVDSRGYAYVAHITAGLEQPHPTFPPEPWNPEPGGISVVDLTARQLVDVDGNPLEGTAGAPASGGTAYSRIQTRLYPYSISILKLERNQANYQPGDGWPGEYGFITGVGPQPPEPLAWNCFCRRGHFVIPCGTPVSCDCPEGYQLNCIPNWEPRPLRLGILDLNPWRVKTAFPWELESNLDYWKYLGGLDPGTDGMTLGDSNEGLDFSVASDGQTATVYAVMHGTNQVVTFDFLAAVRDPLNFPYSAVPLTCNDPTGAPISCQPSDVKIQTIGGQPHALISAEAAGSLLTFPLADPNLLHAQPLQACPATSTAYHYPKALDARGDGTLVFIADPVAEGETEVGGISVVGLGPPMSMAGTCRIPLPHGPDRIVVAPESTVAGLAETVRLDLADAAPTAFTEPAKQDALLREWETVRHLQETSANPQAVVVNINNFQRSVNRWITAATLQTDLNQAVDLYRAAYLKDHPTSQ